MGPKSNVTDVHIRRGETQIQTDMQGESHVKSEAEIGAMCLQAKEHQRFPANTRSWKSLEPLERAWPCQHLDL